MAGDKGLTALEKRIVKALLAKGERNQDIHALINYERTPTVNFGRITTVKKDATIQPASDEEIEFFKKRKQSFDPVTGLNLYYDERLMRAREAMILAVTISTAAPINSKPACSPFLRTSLGLTFSTNSITARTVRS
jgi:hypothetical protein